MVRLRRVSPSTAGWTRRRAGRGFVYLDHDGQRLPDIERERILALVIPPAWEDLWISPIANGHLQAVGTDAAGRRQYLYHPEWRVRKDKEKFERVQTLGRALPKVRRRLVEDLGSEVLDERRACALAVRLLDLGYFRIGSDIYADEYGSFGLTTLERRHVRTHRGAVVFEFTGKSGVEHAISIDDPFCTEVIRVLRQRRGGFESLLAFKQGRRWRRLDAATVNDYVRDVSGLDVSAKDFRTWHATVLAALALAEGSTDGESATARRRVISTAMKEVAAYLGNTPTVARSSYVDPRVIDKYESGQLIEVRPRGTSPDDVTAAAERALLRLLD